MPARSRRSSRRCAVSVMASLRCGREGKKRGGGKTPRVLRKQMGLGLTPPARWGKVPSFSPLPSEGEGTGLAPRRQGHEARLRVRPLVRRQRRGPPRLAVHAEDEAERRFVVVE